YAEPLQDLSAWRAQVAISTGGRGPLAAFPRAPSLSADQAVRAQARLLAASREMVWHRDRPTCRARALGWSAARATRAVGRGGSVRAWGCRGTRSHAQTKCSLRART